MATKKTAYVDTTFVITVRVPVDLDKLPKNIRIGTEISDDIDEDVWNDIVNESLDVMDGPNAENIESMTVTEIEDDDEDPEEEENLDDIYNESPEYIHDAALDWMTDHRDFLDDIGQDRFIAMCADRLAKEGYNIKDYYWAVEEAFDDMD